MKIYLAICFLLVIDSLVAQNLIMNPSFEEADVPCGYVRSPESFNEAMSFWTTPSRSIPEIYSNNLDEACLNYYSTNATIMPKNGDNAVGLCVFSRSSHFRAYIQASLLHKLKKDKTYYFDFWISPMSWITHGVDNIGIYLSDADIKVNIFNELFFPPDFVYPQVVTDTLNWTHITGKFTARNEAKYLIIGNFTAPDKVKVEILRNNLDEKVTGVFYLIDDVYLGEKPRDDEGGN